MGEGNTIAMGVRGGISPMFAICPRAVVNLDPRPRPCAAAPGRACAASAPAARPGGLGGLKGICFKIASRIRNCNYN